jgi:hypothetical protein
MNLVKKIILSVAVAATTLSAIPAEAGDRWRGHHRHRSHHDSDGALVAAGVLGLALGALAVGAATSNDEPVEVNPYRHPRPRPDRDIVYGEMTELVDGQEAYGPAFEPWSRSWFRYCEQRYRSFDPETGTYMGYDGRSHFCDAD